MNSKYPRDYRLLTLRAVMRAHAMEFRAYRIEGSTHSADFYLRLAKDIRDLANKHQAFMKGLVA